MKAKINYSKVLVTSKKNGITLLGKNRYGVDDERFLLIPDSEGYYISTYGRLINSSEGIIIPPTHDKYGCEAYVIEYSNGETKTELIKNLMKRVFLPSVKGIIRQLSNNPHNIYRWDLKKLFIEQNGDVIKSEHIPSTKYFGDRTLGAEIIIAKLENRKPMIPEKSFIEEEYLGNMDFNCLIRSKYNYMKNRATQKSIKEVRPHYKDTTISQEWFDDEELAVTYLKNIYYDYPCDVDKNGKLKPLEIDKDFLTFGRKNEYSEETVCFLPPKINEFFKRTSRKSNGMFLGYSISFRNGVYTVKEKDKNNHYFKMDFNEYEKALNWARKARAERIRTLAIEETSKGYMPGYLIQKMNEWATECENGEIEIWEPSIEVKRKLGIVA